MQRICALSVLLVSLLVIGCATDVNTRQALEPMLVGDLQFGDVEAISMLDSVTPEHIDRLRMSVTERIAKLPQGGRLVKVQMNVTEFAIQTPAARFFAGALVGSNRMTVAVKVIDPMGNTVADFDVQRAANPGGYGIFYNQTDATIDAVADGVAAELNGMSGYLRD